VVGTVNWARITETVWGLLNLGIFPNNLSGLGTLTQPTANRLLYWSGNLALLGKPFQSRDSRTHCGYIPDLGTLNYPGRIQSLSPPGRKRIFTTGWYPQFGRLPHNILLQKGALTNNRRERLQGIFTTHLSFFEQLWTPFHNIRGKSACVIYPVQINGVTSTRTNRFWRKKRGG